jgi:hypothetical protein
MMLLDVDPNLVKPGWTPLIILVLLGIATALLFLSMRKQFRKINVEKFQGTDASEPKPVDHSET